MEVVFVVCLGLVAAGLLLTYLPGQRERAKLATCQHHLRLQGEAIRDFSDGKAAPPGPAPVRNGPCLPPSRLDSGYATWAVLVAPYLNAKASPLVEWDQRKTYYDQPDAVRQSWLPVQFCPARARTFFESVAGDTKDGKLYAGALGDYAAAVSNGQQTGAWDGPDANGAIVPARIDEMRDSLILAWSGRVTRADLEKQRGLAYTLLVGEKHVPPDAQGNAEMGDGSVYNGAHSSSFARIGGSGYPIAPTADSPVDRNFGSAHPEGRCNFLFADGSVKTFTPALDPTLLSRWINRQ